MHSPAHCSFVETFFMLADSQQHARVAKSIYIPRRTRVKEKLTQILLASGVLSSLFYVAMNIFVPMQLPGYNASSQTVSELSAIDVPTRTLWVILAAVYTLLVATFGWGVLKSAGKKRFLRLAGILLIVYGLIGLAWPPMHQREVLAAGGGTLTDTLHIAFTMVAVLLMFFIIAFSASSLGKAFRLYSIATVLVLLVFGILTGLDAPRLEANLPTPWQGVWERISIGAYVLWIMVLAITLMRKHRVSKADW